MANNIGGKPPASLTPQQADTSAPTTARAATAPGRQPILSTRDLSAPTVMQRPEVLHQAAARGDYPTLLDALKRGIWRVNEVDPHTGRTPLQAAQIGKHEDAVQLLINAGARVHPLEPGDKPGSVSLYAAAEEGNPELLAALLPCPGAALNEPDPQSGLTPLMFATRGKHLKAVDMLLQAGAKASRIDARGRLPAVEAAAHDNTALLALLLERGASAQRPDNAGTTPLMAASILGNLDSMALLLKRGALVDQTDSSGATALFRALMSGSADKVRLLLDNGADAGHADRSGRTPLMLAKQLSLSQDIVLLLEQHGSGTTGTRG